MTLQQALRTSSTRNWQLMVLLALLAAPILWFIQHNALMYLAYDAKNYGPFWSRRFGLIPHIIGGVVAILVGLVQLWLGATGRTHKLHRTLGKIYLGAVTVGSLAGFYLALTTGGPLSYGSGLFFLSFAWVLTTSMGYLASRRKAFDQHRQWMIRSYIVTFAFVSDRLFEQLLSGLNVAPLAEIDAMLAWASWTLPLLLAEPFLQYRRLRRY